MQQKMYKLIAIDDEQYVLESLKKLIPNTGKEFELVGTAEDGNKALELIKKSEPDVVLTDICMPNIDGLELLHTISTSFPSIKTVILSAHSDFKYAQRAIEYGACAYLLKPVQEESLHDIFMELRQKIENSNRLDNKLRESLPLLQRNLLWNIVMETIKDPNQIKQKLRDLEIFLNEDYMAVSLFTFDRLTDDNKKYLPSLIDLFYEKTRSYFSKINYYVFYNSDHFCILANSSRKLSKNIIEYEMKAFKDYIEDFLDENNINGYKVSIGIGSIFSGIKNISCSYRDAVLALNNKFFRGMGSIINVEDIKTKDFPVMDDSTLFEKVCGLIDSMFLAEKSELRYKINSIFDDAVCLNKSGNSNSMIFKCMEIIMFIYFKLQEKSVQLKMSNKENTFANFSSKNSLYDLKIIFVKEIEQILEELNLFKRSNPNWSIIKIKEYINEHYSEKITLEEVAKVVFLNESYLSVFFKERTGMFFSDYILNVRIEKGKEMLKKSNLMVCEIAEKAGFSDYRYFCKVFKKEVNMSPLEYRNSYT